MIDWMLHNNQLPTSEQLSSCLQCVCLVLQNLQLSQQIDKQPTWLCSLVSMVYQVVLSCKYVFNLNNSAPVSMCLSSPTELTFITTNK